ncbi:MAG TPA: 3-phosphoshikimate 1-carboxyvinyltransferase [Candidatus Phocaeicola gallistercoris]|nr:3-phosphoshikimate 1-carboxyvinyltransferase [Candidatus Phocaeicola gallistercoris]
MKQITITSPRKIQVSVSLPASKSICNRALIINALTQDCLPLKNLSDCDDTQVMQTALSALQPVIDIKAAGTAMRFLSAFLAVSEGTHIITGTQRMQQRPIGILVNALRSLGADITYIGKEGFPPLRITGKNLPNKEVTLSGSVSSQYISALLMIGPTLTNGLTLTLTDEIISRPYIDLTLKLMSDFGAKVKWINDHQLKVEPHPYCPTAYTIENDWSAASYWYEICALSDDAIIQLPGLFPNSPQGDSIVAELFSVLGVESRIEKQVLTLHKTAKKANRLEYNFINQPDLAQTFVVTCALLNIPFHFNGLQSLKIKETDRITALIKEMKKLGYVLTETNGCSLSWNGERCTPDANPCITTYEDHRMAMAFAPACFIYKNLQVNDPDVVNKSYPQYWQHLINAGFHIKEGNK